MMVQLTKHKTLTLQFIDSHLWC